MRNPPWDWDELVLACALVASNDWKELRENDMRVMELSDLLQRLPLHTADVRGAQFRSTGSVSRKTTDLATCHPSYRGKATRGGSLDKVVAAAFLARPEEMIAAAAQLRAVAVQSTLPEIDPDDQDHSPSAPEGRLLARLHRVRERDPRLRKQKVRAVLAAGGELRCEVCSFSFTETYGTLGAGYIEVHHMLPLHAAGERVTSIDDLALLCSNCHRMCHKSVDPGESWRSPAALRALLRSRQQPDA